VHQHAVDNFLREFKTNNISSTTRPARSPGLNVTENVFLAIMNTFIRQSGRKDSKKDIYTAIKKKLKMSLKVTNYPTHTVKTATTNL